jgi:predicted DNA-binding transcriptional regulator YafY
MDRTERFYKIDQLLQQKGVVRLDEFLGALDVSRATFKRVLEYMRDSLHAPIEWDREARGYRFVGALPDAPNYQLPGLWFNASEIRALLTMQQLLSDVQPGLLEPHIAPLRARLRSLLDIGDHPADEVERRIKLVHLGARRLQLPHFELVANALLKRQRLRLVYGARGSNQITTREISPQRLVHYRENWYVDAWCHLREDIRSFAVDAIQSAQEIDKKAKAVPDRDLDEVLAAGYGIFSGRKTQWASLRFSASAARWVGTEHWHPKQQGEFDAQGRYVLKLPYSDSRELLMDVLRYGPEAEVLAPPALREAAQTQLRAALKHYA